MGTSIRPVGTRNWALSELGPMSTANPRVPNPKSGDLAAEVVQDVQRLINLEVALAKQELKELAITNAIAVVCFAAAGLLAGLAPLVAGPGIVVSVFPWSRGAADVWARPPSPRAALP